MNLGGAGLVASDSCIPRPILSLTIGSPGCWEGLTKNTVIPPFYVHLKRSDAETARSFTKRYSFGIIKAYRDNGILTGLPEDTDPFAVALDYCDTVNSNIDLFHKDKTHKIVIELNDVEQGFAEFWRRIGTEGDFNAALFEFSVKHNQTTIHHERIFNGPGSRGPNRNNLIARASSKIKRAIGNFPGYLRAV